HPGAGEAANVAGLPAAPESSSRIFLERDGRHHAHPAAAFRALGFSRGLRIRLFGPGRCAVDDRRNGARRSELRLEHGFRSIGEHPAEALPVRPRPASAAHRGDGVGAEAYRLALKLVIPSRSPGMTIMIHRAAKIAFGIMPCTPMVPSTTCVT